MRVGQVGRRKYIYQNTYRGAEHEECYQQYSRHLCCDANRGGRADGICILIYGFVKTRRYTLATL